ncbi:NAD(P)-dependent alcohol dehydrogenase [Chondromyces apiculatus]|uniref:Alcohol dehydrogenase, zinc-binding protein n=1 Tax=Chondromyces apiculatus DSM 436 TaxID=1192034 RepID=A0A017TFX9_9BACT|nr:NAD(P)-dependent alcohol dehydrogenase [Chondromyces apiculatus]EYF07501.1 Alcohol dehydrogenase, zinc-binding protein [Chondromyces apiculatus DSM 436]
MEIRAAIARAREPFTVETCELAPPAAGEVLVKVEACGICHTDLTAKDKGMGTPLPAVLGHEGVGRIQALGEGVRGFEMGERVVMSFGACGQCPSCIEGGPAYCQHALDFNLFGRRVDGTSPISLGGASITGHYFGQSSFATHAVAASANLVRLGEDLPVALMASLACGVQTGMGSILNVLDAGPEDTLAILGCGTVGLAAVMAARIAACRRVIAVDLNDSRLELAATLGATDVVNSAREDVGSALGKLGGLTLAFDNTGVPSVIEAAYGALRPRGQIALAGVAAREARIQLDPNRLMATGRVLRGTVEGDATPRVFIPRMVEWYRSGKLPLHKLVTTYPFERINEAVSDMLSGRVVKPVLLMPSL